MARAHALFADFVHLLVSTTMAIEPWLRGLSPSRRSALANAASAIRWDSRIAWGRLGEGACARFAAAAAARRRIVRDLLRLCPDLKTPTHLDAQAFARSLYVADFGLMFAAELVRAARPATLPEGFAAWLGAEAMRSAREAHALLSAPLYADDNVA